MIRKLYLTLFVLMPLGLFAQSTWTLKSCIDYGMVNNRTNAVYLNERLAADAAAREALADYLPKISLNSTLDANLKVQQSVIPAGVFGPTETRIAFTQKYNSNNVAQLDHILYDQSLLNGLKAGKFNRQQADLNIVKNKETIIYNIGNAYFQIYIYQEQLQLLKANLETYRRQMDISALQVEKGVTLKKDLDKVTVDYNNALSQIRVAESNLTLSYNQLKYEMGFPIKEQLQLDSLAGQDVLPQTASLPNKEFAPSNRSDYRLSEVNLSLLEIDQQRIRSGWLPKLSAFARYGANGFGENLGPALKDLNSYSAVGFKLNFPLLDFFKRNAQYNQAKYKSLNAVENLKLDAGKYELEYENASSTLLKAQASLENDRRNIELAQSVFRTTDLQYKKGITDLTEWLTAQNSIKEAQNNYLNSLYSFLQARMDQEKAAGTLNSFYNSL
jgi:outer membrane protein